MSGTDARLLMPPTAHLNPADRIAATVSRTTVARRIEEACEAARQLIRTIGDVKHLDQDGYLDVAVHRLELRESDLDVALERLHEAIEKTAALTRQMRERRAAETRPYDGPLVPPVPESSGNT